MIALLRSLAVTLALLAGAAIAARYDNGILRMDIPPGFKGPFTQHLAPEATVGAFVKHSPGDKRETLLEITTYDVGAQLKAMPESLRASTTDRHLSQFLSEVQRRRTFFSSPPPTHLKIAGYLASRATWNAVAQGQGMTGVMYCVMAGGVVAILHTQDFFDAPHENRAN